MTSRLIVFAGNAHPELARSVMRELGAAFGDDLTVGRADVGSFDDGEARVRLIDDPRGRDAYFIQPTGQPDRNQTELELMIMSARSAERTTAIIPYFGYARQDRRDQARVPISVVRAVRNLISTGVNRIVTIDLHASQIVGVCEAANAGVQVDHLYARPVILDHLSGLDLSTVTVSPLDAGGGKMVESYWQRLHKMGHPVEMCFAHKSGSSSTGINGVALIGEVAGRDLIGIDDMGSTCRTAAAWASAAQKQGARSIRLCLVHPVVANLDACRRIMDSPINKLIMTDTLPLSDEFRAIMAPKLEEVSVARLIALAIKHLHLDQSMSALFELDGYRAG